MKQLLVSFLSAFLFSACGKSQDPKSLDEAFLLSLQKNKFELVKPYLPDKTFYKSLGNKVPPRTDEEIIKFLGTNNEEIKASWDKIALSAKEKKLDLDRIKLKETLYYYPFTDDKSSEAMIIIYEYNGRDWDDLQFVVSRHKEKTYLLVIPNPTRAFSFTDSSLMASQQARLNIESKKPEFKKSLEDQVKKIIASVQEKKLDAFAENLIYRGNDERKKWNTALNVNDSLEREAANEFMGVVSRSVEGCGNFQTGEIQLERESEGTWIIFPARCANRTVQFAFLKVGDKVLLGDIAETRN